MGHECLCQVLPDVFILIANPPNISTSLRLIIPKLQVGKLRLWEINSQIQHPGSSRIRSKAVCLQTLIIALSLVFQSLSLWMILKKWLFKIWMASGCQMSRLPTPRRNLCHFLSLQWTSNSIKIWEKSFWRCICISKDCRMVRIIKLCRVVKKEHRLNSLQNYFEDVH